MLPFSSIGRNSIALLGNWRFCQHSSEAGGGQNGKYCRQCSGLGKQPLKFRVGPIPGSDSDAQAFIRPNSISYMLGVAAQNGLVSERGCLHGALQYLQYLSFCPSLDMLLCPQGSVRTSDNATATTIMKHTTWNLNLPCWEDLSMGVGITENHKHMEFSVWHLQTQTGIKQRVW